MDQEVGGQGEVVGCQWCSRKSEYVASDGLQMASARGVILFALRCIVYMNVGIGGASATISLMMPGCLSRSR